MSKTICKHLVTGLLQAQKQLFKGLKLKLNLASFNHEYCMKLGCNLILTLFISITYLYDYNMPYNMYKFLSVSHLIL